MAFLGANRKLTWHCWGDAGNGEWGLGVFFVGGIVRSVGFGNLKEVDVDGMFFWGQCRVILEMRESKV